VSHPDARRVSALDLLPAISCLALLPALAYGTDLLQKSRAGGVAVDWPAAPSSWQGPQAEVSTSWMPVFAHADAFSRAQYVDPSGSPVQVFVAAYREQRQGAKLVSYGNTLFGGDGRLQLLDEHVIASASGSWREALLRDRAGTQSIVWARYRIGDRIFLWPRGSQLWYGLVSFMARPVSSVVAVYAACKPDCASARSRLGEASARLAPSVRPIAREQGREAP
jgi:EpsI family protein